MPLSNLSSRRSQIVGAVFALFALSMTAPAQGLPPGRAWMPTDRLAKPGYLYLAGPRLETDTLGTPAAFVAAVFGPEGDAIVGYGWRGDRWTETWQIDREPGYLWPVLAPRGQQYLVWVDYAPVPERPGPYARLLMAEVLSDGVGTIDTLAIVHDKTVQYAAAVSPQRRWVLADEPLRGLRLFYSDSPHVWGELPVSGSGAGGLAATALEDSTVLLAAANGPITWGIVRGSTWAGGVQPIPENSAYTPRFRPRPSGGQWLGWAPIDETAAMITFRDGAWSAPETLRCFYRSGGQHFSNCVDLSRDPGEYPAVAWSAEHSGSITVCACMPSDTGFTLADELEGSLTDGCPTVARDTNGDVWVAWWRYFQGLSWTHTYTSALATAPRVTGAGRERTISWALSEPAPGSWWTVQRCGNHGPRPLGWRPRVWDADGEFLDVARVRAGEGLEMAWIDDSPPAGVLRYRIRRDCVDQRYEWLSEEASWPPQNLKPRPIRLAARGMGIERGLELVGAAGGEFVVQVFDIQGRLVHRQRDRAEADESKTFRLGLGARGSTLRSGVYFIRVRDALGNESNAVKTVLLK